MARRMQAFGMREKADAGEEMSPYLAGDCSYCRSSISAGQRWVREKIFGTECESGSATYDWFHADPFTGQERSCWEQHELEREKARLSHAA